MEVVFTKSYLVELYEGETVLPYSSNQAMVRQYIKVINLIDSVVQFDQLYQFNGLKMEKLHGDKKALYSVRINQKYRLLFKLSKRNIIEIIDISNHYE